MSVVRYTLTLHPVLDQKIIQWLEQQPNVAAAIREALYQNLDQPSRAELAIKLDRLVELVQTHPSPSPLVIPQLPETQSEEPEAALKGLGKMLGKFQSDRVHTNGYE